MKLLFLILFCTIETWSTNVGFSLLLVGHLVHVFKVWLYFYLDRIHCDFTLLLFAESPHIWEASKNLQLRCSAPNGFFAFQWWIGCSCVLFLAVEVGKWWNATVQPGRCQQGLVRWFCWLCNSLSQCGWGGLIRRSVCISNHWSKPLLCIYYFSGQWSTRQWPLSWVRCNLKQ